MMNKKLRIMGKIGLILIAFSMQNEVLAQLAFQDSGRKENRNVQRRSLKAVLLAFQDQHHVSISFQDEDVENVTVNAKVPNYSSVDEALKDLLRPLGLKYEKIQEGVYVISKAAEGVLIKKVEGKRPDGNQKAGKAALLTKIAATTQVLKRRAQDVMVKGKITSQESGEPLPGVNILVKGTTTGTVSDIDGNYSIMAPENATLVFSFIGYATREIPVQGRSVLDVALATDTKSLQEVVVVGYGTQKKVNVTGAVSSVDFDEDMANRPITNASQALAGKVTGVWVSQNSGAPGSDGATLRIRGFGTLNNTNPLVLIDGVEGRLAELNPNDVASMTVLKDAASAAIYGSRAANGVVLVTTKRGSYDAGPQLSYNGYYGLQKLGMRYDVISNSAEYMEIWNSAVENSGGDPLFPRDVIDGFETGQDPYRYPNTDYFDEVFRTAPITEHNLSVRGGGAKQNYYLSLNYLSQEGIIRETNSERFGVNFNLNTRINERIELGGRLRATRKVTNRPYDDIGRAIYMMANGHPFSAPYTRDGRFGATQAIYLSGSKAGEPIVDTRNPLPDIYNGKTQYTNNFLKGSLNATVSILPGLTFKTLYAGQYNNNLRDRYNETIYVYTDAGVETKTLDFPSQIINQRYITDEFYWVFYNTLNYEKTFAGKHNISAIAGMQTEEETLKTTNAQRSDPPKEGLHQVDAGTSNQIAEGNETAWRMLSYFGRVNYNFKQKYLLEATLRADASSRFKEGNRWGLFPSVSAGWRLSEEGFMQNVTFIDNLKIRASWGRLGNQNINEIAGDYPYLVFITQNYGSSYNLDGQLMPGAAITAIVDETITWETTRSTDIGLELGVMDNRLSLEFDYFTKNTKDILVRLPIPQILGGLTAPVKNVGEMQNNGVELSVNYRSDAYDKNWNYRIGANISYVDNEVVTFRGGKSPDQLYLIREGISYRALYGLNAVGVYQSDSEAEAHLPENGYTPSAGDLKYEDVNSDGKINYLDKQVLGNTIPKYTYGVNLGLSFKGWSLDIVTQGIADVSAYTQNAWTEPLGISGGTVTERWRNAWTEENHSTILPQIKVNDTWNRQESSFWMANLSYFKIKNIQLSYNFPQEWLENAGITSAACYLNVQNAHSFVSDQYEGFDPERDTFNSGYNQYPSAIITSLGINVQF